MNFVAQVYNLKTMSTGTRESSFISNPQNYEALLEKITLSNSDLHVLSGQAEKFSERIIELNEEGIKKLLQQRLEEAMIYFSEAERNLEYVASCGKTINRVLITATLKNKACAHQKLWELGPSSDYMEALLLNLRSSLETEPNIEVTDDFKMKTSHSFQQFSKFLNRRILIGLCQLQNSALVSQTGDHVAAKRSAENSLQHFELICSHVYKYQKAVKGKNSELLQYLTNNCLVNQKTTNIDKMMKKTKFNLHKLRKHRHFFSFNSQSISQVSIGDIMQIGHMSVEKAEQNIDPDYYISQLGIIYLAIYIGCAHFVIAAETRLLNQDKYGELLKKSTKEYIQSQIAHLHSVSLIAGVVMLESYLLAHIMKSFKNHYGIDLEYEDDYFEELSSIEGVSQRAILTNNQVEIQLFDEINREQMTTGESQSSHSNYQKCLKPSEIIQKVTQDKNHQHICLKISGIGSKLKKECVCCEHTVASTPSNIKRVVKGKKCLKSNRNLQSQYQQQEKKGKVNNKMLLTFQRSSAQKTDRSKKSSKGSKSKQKGRLIKVKSSDNLKQNKDIISQYYKKTHTIQSQTQRSKEEGMGMNSARNFNFKKVSSPSYKLSREKSRSKSKLVFRKKNNLN